MNVLVIAQYVPMPDRQADMLRLTEILRIVAARHSISLLVTDVSAQERLYGKQCVSASIVTLERLGVRLIKESQAFLPPVAYQVVVFEYYLLALSRMERLRFRFPRAVMVIDTVDINYLRLASQERAANAGGSSAAVEAIKEAELDTYARADIVVAISEDESGHLLEALPKQTLHVIPLIFQTHPLRKKERSAAQLLFVGNFSHQANVDAARHAIDDILPLIRRSIPAARILIVGNRPPPSLVSDPSRGVEVVGFVADLESVYARCDIGIAPLTWGGGLKGKVAEAMAHGLPIVTTSVGASGFEFRHRAHALIADTPADFAAAVIELHEDRPLYDRIRLDGHAFVERHYSRRCAAHAIDELFELVDRTSPAQLTRSRRLRLALDIAFHRHFGWRLERKARQRQLSTE